MTPALQALDVHAALGGAPVLQGVTLSFAPGRWTSLVGPNGAGKSSLLRVLAQLLDYRGEVRLQGSPAHRMKVRERATRLAWLGQNESVSEDLSVYELAMLGRLPHQAWLAAPAAPDVAAVEQALRACQIWDWRHRMLAQLSGGERQRALLARALAVQAAVLLLDEPLNNLDPPHQADCLALARQLARAGTTVVSALHEISGALQADDMVILAAGRVLHHGPCDDPATHRALEQVFAQRIAVRRLDDQWLALPKL